MEDEDTEKSSERNKNIRESLGIQHPNKRNPRKQRLRKMKGKKDQRNNRRKIHRT